MCGITAICSNNPAAATPERLQRMTRVLAHRGPDGEGCWYHPQHWVALGHRRLAILDLSEAGNQPLHYTATGSGYTYTIIHNGEIYNYVELRQQLEQVGYRFSTGTDTEVIAAAYDRYQEACLSHLDGMFAFVLWDERRKQLFCARDRFGEKPLYYSFDGTTLLLASEMKALWAAGIAKSWNHLVLLGFLANGHTTNAVDASLTFYKDVFAVPPGHYATYRPLQQELMVQLYWDLDKQAIQEPAADPETTFIHLLTESLQRRLRSDVPVGSSLSGGLDSSAIVALCQQLHSSSHSYKAFTAVFPGFAKDEAQQAQTVAHQFQLQHHTVAPDAAGLVNDFSRLCYHQEQPFSSASVYAQYKVMELAQRCGVTVLLDGQGADETLAGYTRYVHWYLQELLLKFRYGFAMQERIRLQQNGVPFRWGWPNYLAAFFPMIANAHLEEQERKRILMHPHISREYTSAHYDKYYSVFKPPVSKLNDILYFNTMQQGLGELLHYADRNSMAFGREVRLPFLSHQLVEFVFTLPAWHKIHNGFQKWILRQSMDKLLPADIVWRKDKTGFEPPQQQWMQHPQLQEMIMESRKKLVEEKILNASVLNAPLQAKAAYEADNADWRYLTTAAQF